MLCTPRAAQQVVGLGTFLYMTWGLSLMHMFLRPAKTYSLGLSYGGRGARAPTMESHKRTGAAERVSCNQKERPWPTVSLTGQLLIV